MCELCMVMLKWLGGFEGYDVHMTLVCNFPRNRSSLIVFLCLSLSEVISSDQRAPKLSFFYRKSFHIKREASYSFSFPHIKLVG